MICKCRILDVVYYAVRFVHFLDTIFPIFFAQFWCFCARLVRFLLGIQGFGDRGV